MQPDTITGFVIQTVKLIGVIHGVGHHTILFGKFPIIQTSTEKIDAIGGFLIPLFALAAVVVLAGGTAVFLDPLRPFTSGIEQGEGLSFFVHQQCIALSGVAHLEKIFRKIPGQGKRCCKEHCRDQGDDCFLAHCRSAVNRSVKVGRNILAHVSAFCRRTLALHYLNFVWRDGRAAPNRSFRSVR